MRAGYKCEYCHIHQANTPFTHQIDHIIPRKHEGETAEHNLACACMDCNRFKGSDIAAFDLETGMLTRLFNPRTQVWADHFTLDGASISGQTAVGRVTVRILRFNDPLRLLQRQALIDAGQYG